MPRDAAGVRVDKRWDVIGLRSSATYQVSLNECRVPASNALRGNGLRLLEVGLNASRIRIATTAVGSAAGQQSSVREQARPVREQIEVMANQCLAASREMIIGKLLRDVHYASIVEGGDDVLRELMFSRYVVPVSKRS
ncbi:MAG: hypothetical protein ABI775_03765 [Pseudonocardiales bacterium]